MKSLLASVAVIVMSGGACLPVSAESFGPDWMLGCWESEDGSSREVWVRQSDRQLIGFSVALEGGRVVFYEVLGMEKSESGFHYTAHPAGQAGTTFSAAESEGQKISFTNATHDYPQRINYRLEEGQLRARISRLDGSDLVVFDKSKCE